MIKEEHSYDYIYLCRDHPERSLVSAPDVLDKQNFGRRNKLFNLFDWFIYFYLILITLRYQL